MTLLTPKKINYLMTFHNSYTHLIQELNIKILLLNYIFFNVEKQKRRKEKEKEKKKIKIWCQKCHF